MKRITLLLSLTLLIFVVRAQESGFGIKGGVNLSTYEFSENGNSVTPDRVGKPHFGFFYTGMVNKNFAIQPEVLYHSTGYDPSANSGINSLYADYLALPVMFKLYIFDKINIHAGPEIAFLLGARANDVNIKDGIKTTNFSIGMGTELYLYDYLGVSFRYSLGLTNTNKSDLDVSQKSDNIQISLIMKF